MKRALDIVGKIMVYALIIISLAIFVPKLLGYEVYNVVSGSMEPEIKTGSAIYVRTCTFDSLSVGDVVTFLEGESVVSHRIVEIDSENKLLTTKGDANDTEDLNKVSGTAVLGKVVFSVPFVGSIFGFFTTTIGKIFGIILIVIGVLLQLIASKLSERRVIEDGALTGGVEIVRNYGLKQRYNNRKKKSILIIGIVLIIGALAVAGFIFYDSYSSDKKYEDLRASYVTVDESASDWSSLCTVDFEGLTAQNSEVVAWIYVENTDISYPVMYSGDDSTYLHANIDKNYSKEGSIFEEALNATDFSDSHSIIYGHNMRNLSMFGSLKYYKADDTYYDEHQYFQLLLPDGTKYRYQIFSYFDTPEGSFVYTVPYGNTSDFAEYIKELLSSSYRDCGVDVDSADKVVTLSTCSAEDLRFVVNGVLADTK